MLGVLSDDDFLAELSRTIGSVRPLKAGRGNNDNVPSAVRALVAETALDGASNQSVADAFSVSPSSVSAYKNGATSCATYNEPEAKLAKVVDNKKQKIQDMAHSNIINALRAITPEKISDASLKIASGVARDMSAIIKNMQDEPQKSDGVQFVIFAPQIKTEADYNKPIEVLE
jgi:predicted transcriptional regulator